VQDPAHFGLDKVLFVLENGMCVLKEKSSLRLAALKPSKLYRFDVLLGQNIPSLKEFFIAMFPRNYSLFQTGLRKQKKGYKSPPSAKE
jgi:hypothetical protein